ncbi:hypothetical protein L207DRAFT_511997 [Hyaloscypha variabilis F]|uniref:Uncharacterized protein n=1 Tax=Hyaloscypha variabilis (strain UAMH 11265 / GT02V1 / F) TaxID=1149755 RepID=A0A2J6RPT5_HYAVF|nr:hypothetical protein L207DRAFT_511997 [Hyaloscypha variabilis F]
MGVFLGTSTLTLICDIQVMLPLGSLSPSNESSNSNPNSTPHQASHLHPSISTSHPHAPPTHITKQTNSPTALPTPIGTLLPRPTSAPNHIIHSSTLEAWS